MKITREHEAETLQRLIVKWRSAGREAAEEFWSLVKDSPPEGWASEVGSSYPGTNVKSGAFSDGFDTNWGWGGSDQTSSDWGWTSPTAVPDDDDCKDIEFVSPTKLEQEFYRELRKPTIPRKTRLPPTPRGSYFSQRFDDAQDSIRLENMDEDVENGKGQRIWTLGVMLSQTGIAHSTLGWVEEEGDFVDN